MQPQRIVPSYAGRLTECLRISDPYFDAARRPNVIASNGRAAAKRVLARDDSPPDRPRDIIDFVGSSYLGLDTHPVIAAGAIEAIEAQQSLHSSYAKRQYNFDLLTELEENLSEMFCARVLVFSSVILANLGAMLLLASGQLTGGKKPVVVFDSLACISLARYKPVADEAQVRTIDHNDIDALERLCCEHPVVAYVCDGVYCTGGYSPIKELRQLQERYGLFLYIDDAHGISTCGRHGEGFARSQFLQILGERTIIAGSLAKGFGASGGMLMLGAAHHEKLFRGSYVLDSYSVSPNPAAVGAALASCKIHRSAELGRRQEQLVERIAFFDRRVATFAEGSSVPIRMVSVRSQANAIAIAKGLFDFGFDTLAMFLPAAGGRKAAIRLCITAEHQAHDIERLCDCILEKVEETTGKPYPLG
ncbi:aminotransferase class I/II-fold pyridoxal phosphate-dependent enzyme [Bradyrhizobium sp. 197]|uniref:aminotransferase class I/II-fold pyridoxal phosphate-dependent enzyme n=1 Tax=Bradyrhizobium sp. 197 TaxID=2782663 RepID=UPI001FFAF986